MFALYPALLAFADYSEVLKDKTKRVGEKDEIVRITVDLTVREESIHFVRRPSWICRTLLFSALSFPFPFEFLRL